MLTPGTGGDRQMLPRAQLSTEQGQRQCADLWPIQCWPTQSFSNFYLVAHISFAMFSNKSYMYMKQALKSNNKVLPTLLLLCCYPAMGTSQRQALFSVFYIFPWVIFKYVKYNRYTYVLYNIYSTCVCIIYNMHSLR